MNSQFIIKFPLTQGHNTSLLFTLHISLKTYLLVPQSLQRYYRPLLIVLTLAENELVQYMDINWNW